MGEIYPTNSPEDIRQIEDGLSKVVQDLREECVIIFDVRTSIAVIFTRPVRLTYVDSVGNTSNEITV